MQCRLRQIFRLVVLFVMLNGCGTPVSAADGAAENGLLIIFVQPEASNLARRFQVDHLPRIIKLSKELGIETRVVDAGDGVPREITITPLIVFQNSNGRSIYQGRYTTLDRLRNFIRTSSFVPQSSTSLVREDVPVWEHDRTHVVMSIKLTDVTGQQPPGFDQKTFQHEALQAINKGLRRFKNKDRIELSRSDRTFYVDFHPYLDADDMLHVSTAVYSQFHCEKPILISAQSSFTGTRDNAAAVFAEVAGEMEAFITENISASEIGDGFDPIFESTPVVSWQALGLAMPKNSNHATSGEHNSVVLSTRWSVQPGSPNDPPRMQFRFAAPLDSFAGEVTDVQGTITFNDQLQLASMSGNFEADPASVTMGDPDLDQSIFGSTTLDVKNHPKSSFVIDTVTMSLPVLSFGEQASGEMRGQFTMKGVSIPIAIRTSFEPILNAVGEPRLILTGAFQLHMKEPFDIFGPDGPAPANDTLLFDFNLILVPEELQDK